MKKLMTIAMLIILAPLAQAGDNNQVGRYQLVAVDVDHSGTHTLFKIDTVTGQAWTYTEAEVAPLGKPPLPAAAKMTMRFWSSINEQELGPNVMILRTIVGR